MTQRTQYHDATGREFLAKARAYLAEDDLLQASEKGWGAAAQMVKAAAEARGWRHNGHAELYRAIDAPAAEADDPQILRLFNSAGALYMNFYEGWMTRNLVDSGLTEVEQLVRKLDELLP